ncbi:MAG: hypothetical protein ACLUOF_06895 [Ruminococcus sp.]
MGSRSCKRWKKAAVCGTAECAAGNYSAIAGSLERIQAQAADVPAVRDECRRAMESVRHGLELL